MNRISNWFIRRKIKSSLSAIQNLRGIKQRNEIENLWKLRFEIRKLPSSDINDQVVSTMIKLLNSSNSHIRKRAASILGTIGDQRAALPIIETYLKEPLTSDEFERTALLQALRDLRQHVTPILIDLLHNYGEEGKYYQGKIIKLIKRFGDDRAVEPLIDLLQFEVESNNDKATLLIVTALADIAGTKVLEPIKSMYKKAKRLKTKKYVALALEIGIRQIQGKDTQEQYQLFTVRHVN